MSDCIPQQRPDGQWFCAECDRGLPGPARRKCDKNLAAVTTHPSAAEQLVAQARALKREQPGDAVDDDEIRRRVEACGECSEFVEQVPACEERLDGSMACEVTRGLVVRITRGRCQRW